MQPSPHNEAQVKERDYSREAKERRAELRRQEARMRQQTQNLVLQSTAMEAPALCEAETTHSITASSSSAIFPIEAIDSQRVRMPCV